MPNWTWNFLNEGGNNGSLLSETYDVLLKAGGCTVANWGDFNMGQIKKWISGYDSYVDNMNNRVKSVYKIQELYDPAQLNLLKHWVHNHNEGGTSGGLAVISDQFNIIPAQLPIESDYAFQEVVTQWGPNSNHALTIVGYCDGVKYDFNGDNQFTNDIDLNGDNILNVRDWEIGAFKVANSAGGNWSNDGSIWIPYKVMAENTPGGGTNPTATVIEVEDKTLADKGIVIKGKVAHGNRFKLGMGSGYSESANDLQPDEWFSSEILSVQGGPFPMNGYNDTPLEFAIDYSFYNNYENNNIGKIFSVIVVPTSSENAYFDFLSMIDYRWNEEFELFYSEEPFVLQPMFGYYYLGIPYDLIPHEANIEEDLDLFSDMVSRFTPTVSNGATLTVENGVSIDMYNSEIHIEQGSSLVIEDNAIIHAKAGICKVVVNGNFSMGSNVSFIADEGAQIQLVIDNPTLSSTINTAVFERGLLQSNQASLTLNSCSFDVAGGVEFSAGNLVVNGCQFDGASLYAANGADNYKKVTVYNQSSFTGADGYAVHLSQYPNFYIHQNQFELNSNGIGLFHCGSGRLNRVSDNLIEDNGIGIVVYHSTAAITSAGQINNGNIIRNNHTGIQCLDKSHVNLSGYIDADYWNETQQITDNDYREIYATQGSFPCPFTANAIFDDDNAGNPYGDPMVSYSTTNEEQLDVKKNYWGSGFSYLDDLNPSELYLWEPVWELSGYGGGDADAAIYMTAESKIEQEDYTGAKSDLQQLVATYPESIYSEAALKELYALEEYTGNNYSWLKGWYRTNPSIQSDAGLTKLADFQANFCDIKLENWPTAIAWFENVIQNPETMEDSIFAIIDLGYTYFLMENSGLKAAYSGNMIEHKPVSSKKFEEKRDYLLSLLREDYLSENMKESIGLLKPGELLQNVPNPFSGQTQIWFKLDEVAVVTINIVDNVGKRIKTYDEGILNKGSFYVEFNAEGLPPGIYFYSIEVNGKLSDSKKMVVVK
ncbi:MAG: T9SS type A sorting domain-containing protein [Bacteroidales bacterium]